MEEKLGDSIISPTKDRHSIARLTCSFIPPSVPPSVSLSSHSPSLELRLLGKIFTKLPGLTAILGLLKKTSSLTAVCMDWAVDEALGSSGAYTIG